MSAISLQVTYRKGEPFAAYLYLGHKPGEKSVRTAKITDDLLVDYAADGRPVGIKIVSPLQVKLEDIYGIFDELGLGRPEPNELRPLEAA